MGSVISHQLRGGDNYTQIHTLNRRRNATRKITAYRIAVGVEIS